MSGDDTSPRKCRQLNFSRLKICRKRFFYVFNVIGFQKVGGMEGLWEKYPSAIGDSIITHITNTTSATNATSMNVSLTTTVITTLAANTSNFTTTTTLAPALTACYGVEKHWDNMFRSVQTYFVYLTARKHSVFMFNKT